jgi:hypothetical protein
LYSPLSENIKFAIKQEEKELNRTRREIKKYKDHMLQREEQLEKTRKQWKAELDQLELNRLVDVKDGWKSPYQLYKERTESVNDDDPLGAKPPRVRISTYL